MLKSRSTALRSLLGGSIAVIVMAEAFVPAVAVMEVSGPLPATDFSWVRATQTTNRPYGEAACVISRWLANKDARDAVLKLIAEINAGSSFSKAYR